MSAESEKGRAANKAKAHRLCHGGNEKVDASSWDPGQTFSAEKKKGPRPVNPREYKRGGTVKIVGEGSTCHAGRKPRKSGGRAHGDEKEDRALVDKMVKGECRTGREDGGRTLKELGAAAAGGLGAGVLGGLKKGGRACHASGGRTKGKTNINIIIDAGKGGGQDGAPPPGVMPRPAPPMPAAPPPAPMGGGMPPGAGPAMPQMPRRSGGRTNYKDMDAGAGSGKGRLEKEEIQRNS